MISLSYQYCGSSDIQAINPYMILFYDEFPKEISFFSTILSSLERFRLYFRINSICRRSPIWNLFLNPSIFLQTTLRMIFRPYAFLKSLRIKHHGAYSVHSGMTTKTIQMHQRKGNCLKKSSQEDPS